MSGCDHKFYGTTNCVKCGWVPPKADLDVLRAQKLVCTSVDDCRINLVSVRDVDVLNAAIKMARELPNQKVRLKMLERQLGKVREGIAP